MKDHRIGWLDSFRAFAVIGVVLLHLTNPTTSHYPHHDFFLHIFRFGYLGVQLFFIISGFVISYTLEHTPGFWSFQFNRFSRLFPAMLLCSLLTFGLAALLDNPAQFPDSHEWHNLLPGFTFINPHLWSLTGTSYHWINGSYWTLWVEVQLYLFASVLFYSNKQHFFRNILLAGLGLSLMKYLPGYALNNFGDTVAHYGLTGFFRGWNYAGELFNLSFFIGWFLLGALFYRLYSTGWSRLLVLAFALVMACLLRDAFNYFKESAGPLGTGMVIICGLFFWMILRKKPLIIPGGALLKRTGRISYTVYLVHEVNGLMLINHFYVLLGNFSFLAPWLILASAILFAELSFRWYERPAGIWLRKKLNAWPGK